MVDNVEEHGRIILTQPILKEINHDILHSYYTFKIGSLLEDYIISQIKTPRNCYTLADVLTILKEIIRRKKMYDTKNPAIILCDFNLAKVLGMKGCHVTEIRDIVSHQLLRLPEPYQTKLKEQASEPSNPVLPPREPCDLERSSAIERVDPAIYTDQNARFELKPDFYQTLSTLPHFNVKQTLFAYSEVTLLLSNYILSKKHSILDPHNIKLAIVKDDPLGKAFQVDAFHRCQVTNLLRKQLIYVAQPPRHAIGPHLSFPVAGYENEDQSEVEYEIDSTEESVQTGQESSEDDSEPEGWGVPIEEQDTDTDQENWADTEEETMLMVVGSNVCLVCKKVKHFDGRYCPTCWQNKKSGRPDRPQLQTSRGKLPVFNHDDHQTDDNDLCMICFTSPKNACIIHGRLGHQICCYICGKNLWKKQGRCPVCRRKIEKIIKLFRS